MLPYPGRYESHDSWMRRCDEWESNRRWYNNQQSGLSGKPNRQGVVKEPTKRIPVNTWVKTKGGGISLTYEYVNTPLTREINGKSFEVVRVGYGKRASRSVKVFAEQNGFDFIRENGNGCSGMCKRVDAFAYKGGKYFSREMIYNDDNH